MDDSALTLTSPVAAELERVRQRTLLLIAGLEDGVLERQLDSIMSPLVWDLGHIAAYEDLWVVHRHGGRPLLRPELAAAYDAFETPRSARGDVELLDAADTLAYMEAVRERTLAVLDERGQCELHELVLRHELQHTETMRQTLFLAGLPGGSPGHSPALPREPEWVELPTGPFAMGAPPGGFAYDNERPRHETHVPAFRIARTPVTNASFLHFVEGGGYEYRPWWSDEAWAWKQCYDITGPLGWGDAPPTELDAPVQHVSWFEADAFARSLGARLPTEAEWEKAATWDQDGVLDERGLVWEWTATEFARYPGFEAHPYREYSDVFFDRGYRVLRGGSWASSAAVATVTFRNWDLPERRQIFAGLRLARDA